MRRLLQLVLLCILAAVPLVFLSRAQERRHSARFGFPVAQRPARAAAETRSAAECAQRTPAREEEAWQPLDARKPDIDLCLDVVARDAEDDARIEEFSVRLSVLSEATALNARGAWGRCKALWKLTPQRVHEIRKAFATLRLLVEVSARGYKTWSHTLRPPLRGGTGEIDVFAALVRSGTPDVLLTLLTHDGFRFDDDVAVWAAWHGVQGWSEVPTRRRSGWYYLALPPGRVELFVMPLRSLGVLDVNATFDVSRRTDSYITLTLPPVGRIVVATTTRSDSWRLLSLSGRAHGKESDEEAELRDYLRWSKCATVTVLDAARDTVVYASPGWWRLRLIDDHGLKERAFEVTPGAAHELR